MAHKALSSSDSDSPTPQPPTRRELLHHLRFLARAVWLELVRLRPASSMVAETGTNRSGRLSIFYVPPVDVAPDEPTPIPVRATPPVREELPRLPACTTDIIRTMAEDGGGVMTAPQLMEAMRRRGRDHSESAVTHAMPLLVRLRLVQKAGPHGYCLPDSC